MLVLSRKQKQQIRIGDDIVVTVLQIKGGSVRVGIEAPREVHVMRGELEDFRDGHSDGVAKSRELAGTTAQRVISADANSSNRPENAQKARQDVTDRACQSPSNQRVLELKFEGGGDSDRIVPTRLMEIASSIPSLNLPR